MVTKKDTPAGALAAAAGDQAPAVESSPAAGPTPDQDSPDTGPGPDVASAADDSGDKPDVDQAAGEQAGTDEPAAETTPPPPRPFMSEGVRQDLEMHGQCLDPATGGTWRKADGVITFTPRGGETITL